MLPPSSYRTWSSPPARTVRPCQTTITDSNLSSFWNGQAVAGTWRLFVSDQNVNTGPGEFVLNTTWTWRLDIEVTAVGDLNADTVIDAVDARRLLEGLVGLSPAIDSLSAGDVNADDAIDNLDSAVIVAIGLGLAPDPSLINAFDLGDNIVTVIGQADAVPPGSPVNLRNTTNIDAIRIYQCCRGWKFRGAARRTPSRAHGRYDRRRHQWKPRSRGHPGTTILRRRGGSSPGGLNPISRVWKLQD